MRILIVDDDFVSLGKMKLILAGYGECDAFEHGKLAICAFCKAWDEWRPYSLVMLDIMLKDVSGIEILRRIRELERERRVLEEHRVKIVMVSSDAEKMTIVDCIDSECNDYIIKPFNSTTVAAKLGGIGIVAQSVK